MSIIERTLFPERPLFLLTAGKRGGGKTTAINMVLIAVLGRKAAAAWSWDEEERKKSVFACLLEGHPSVVWDNLTDGAMIASRIFEQITSEEFHTDRILGGSRWGEAAAYTIMAMTGNNNSLKGALAARTLAQAMRDRAQRIDRAG